MDERLFTAFAMIATGHVDLPQLPGASPPGAARTAPMLPDEPPR